MSAVDALMQAQTKSDAVRSLDSPAVVAVVILTGTAGAAVMGLKPALVTAYITHLGVDRTWAGYLIAAEMIAATAGVLLVSARIHIWDRRRLALTGLLLLCAGNLCSMTVAEWSLLFPLRVVAGFGGGIAAGVMAGTLSASLRPDRMFGVYIVGTLLIAAGLFALVHQAMERWGAGGPFLLLALLTFPPLLFNFLFPRDVSSEVSSVSSAHISSTPEPAWVLIFIFGSLLYYFAVGGIWPYLGELGRSAGMDISSLSNAFARSQVWGAVGALVPMLLGLRFGRMMPLMISLTLSTGCLIALITMPDIREVFPTVVQIFMFAWMMFFPYLMGLSARIDAIGRLPALIFMVQGVGFAAGPAICAHLIAWGGYDAMVGFGALGFALAMLLLLPLALRHDRALALSPG